MLLAVRPGSVPAGCTPFTAAFTSFMLYTVSAGFGPSPCRIANRLPCAGRGGRATQPPVKGAAGHFPQAVRMAKVRDNRGMLLSVMLSQSFDADLSKSLHILGVQDHRVCACR